MVHAAADVAAFCQMIANHGVWQGHRYLSEKSWQEMVTRQTPPKQLAVGIVWSLSGPTVIGHGGAYWTHMRIDYGRGFITVFLVQQASRWPNNVRDLGANFEQAVTHAFPPPHP